jgi:Zn-dependent protease with chaperone function
MTGPGDPNEHDGISGQNAWRPAEPPSMPPGPIPPPWAQLPPGSGSRPQGDGRQPKRLPEASAWGNVLAAVPWFFWSLILVIWIGGIFGYPEGWIVVGAWILSGAVVVVGPAEDLLARYLFRLRKPTLIEQERLGPVWDRLHARSGTNPTRFSLWVQESDEVNATPTPGHVVAVTRWALYTLPPQHLEAALAHELSHHLGGRAWLSLLGFWYSIPARAGLIAARAIARLVKRVPAVGCGVLAFLVLAWIGISMAAVIGGAGYIWPIVYLTPFIAPPFLAWVNRWQVKEADRRAASMGYGATLVQVLYGWQHQHQQNLGRETTRRQQVMSNTPTLVERVHTLEQSAVR